MTHSSDSDSSEDSDKGIRYKTDSIRNKTEKKSETVREHLHRKKGDHHRRKRSSSTDEEYERRKRRKEKKRKREKETQYDRGEDRFACKNLISIKNKNEDENSRSSTNLTSTLPELRGNTDNHDTNFGPALPPHLLKNDLSTPEIRGNNTQETETTNTEDTTELKEISPQTIGPALPPDFQKSININNIQKREEMNIETPEQNENSLQSIGPVLPPHLQKSSHKGKIPNTDASNVETSRLLGENSPETIGPVLPPHLQKPIIDNDVDQTAETQAGTVIGPTLPTHLRKQLAEASVQEDNDDDCYGPLPQGAALTRSHLELEERSLQLKINQLNPEGPDEPKREEWMLELPAVRAANLGLGPRTFRMKGTPDLSDRSSWTDTPEDKAKKQIDNAETEFDVKKEAERISLQKRDKQQEEMVKKSKRSTESLVDMHKKKMKEKKKDETASNERRPFSRDIDLQVNRFDEAQKKAVLKKAQLLDDRFSSGQSKFL